MGCCDSHKNTPVQAIKPYAERGCTDLLFAILFIAFWGATVYVVVMAHSDGGDPYKIIRGQDAYGNVCGEGTEASRPFVAWPYPPEYEYKMCVSDCSVTNLNMSQQTPGHAITWPMPSTQVAWYCIPSLNIEGAELNIKFSGAFNADIGTRSFGDLWTAGTLICASAGVALLLAFLYTWFTKHCAGCLVWGCILLTIGGGAAAGYFLLALAAEQSADGLYADNRVNALRYLGWTFVVCTIIFTLVVLFLRNQIRLAIAVVKEASKVMEHIPSLVVFPILPIILATGYVAVWLYAAVFIYSVGTDVEEKPISTCVYQWTGSEMTCDGDSGNPKTMLVHIFDRARYQNFLIAHVFGFLWNIQFLIYFGYTVVAGAVADWYFSSHRSRHDLLRAPLCGSVARTLRFHLGSIALGSLILAIIQFIRGVLAYIQRKTMGDNPNCVARAIFCVVQCCLRVLECCIDKLNKNGFVWMSIWGDNFCVSSCSAFALIWRNLGRVAAVNMVGGYLIVLGKFTVASITTGIFAYLLISTEFVGKLNSPVLPCICIFFVSWSVAYLFMIIFETVIDATFLCFLVDYEHNAGGNMMASASLQKLIGEHAKASEKEAALQHRAKAVLRGNIQGTEYTRLED